jgi:diguanylate cyclase (GGDEF)-like protein
MEPRHARFLWLAGTRGLAPPAPLAAWLGERGPTPDAAPVTLVDARAADDANLGVGAAAEAVAVVDGEGGAGAIDLTMRLGADDLIDLREPEPCWRRRVAHLVDLAQMRREARRRHATVRAFRNRAAAVAPPATERPPVLFVGAAGGDQLRVVDALSGWTVAAYAETTAHARRHLEGGLYAAVIISDIADAATLEATLGELVTIEGPSAPSFVVVQPRHARFGAEHAFALGAHDVMAAGLAVDLVQRRLARAVQEAALRLELREHDAFAGMHDAVTGRVEHGAFHAHLDTLLRAAPHPDAVLACVSLDGLDGLNRAAGFAAGDRALAAVGHALSRTVRPVDVVGRLGGARFAIWFEPMAEAALADVARRLTESAKRATLGDAGPPLGVRVGFARPETGDDAIALARRAEESARRTLLGAAG